MAALRSWANPSARRFRHIAHGRPQKEAIADFDRLGDLWPESAVGYCDRGRAKKMLGRHDVAAADIGKASELDPDFADRGRAG